MEDNIDIDPVDQNHAVILFRIVQEALTNVARHAQATEVTITIKSHGENVFLIVEDNGKGIPEDALSDARSFGLMGMRERARLAGGVLTFDPSGGKGTRVTVRVPGSEWRDGVTTVTTQAQPTLRRSPS